MTLPNLNRGPSTKPQRGFTLLELIVAATILSILTLMAVPLARVTIQREKEKQLRQALWEMRDAIDRYKDAADRGAFQTKVDSQNYPPDLETLVKGVEAQGGKKIEHAADTLDRHLLSPQLLGDPGANPGVVRKLILLPVKPGDDFFAQADFILA